MNVQQALELAEKHAHMNSSAALCLSDAKAYIGGGMHEKYILYRLLDSLEYSVGVFHPDCQAVKAACIATGGRYV